MIFLFASQENGYITIENTPEAIAEHICKYGLYEDITIYTSDGVFLLSTFGLYINKCPDQNFLQEQLLPVLVPKQQKIEDEFWEGSIELGM